MIASCEDLTPFSHTSKGLNKIQQCGHWQSANLKHNSPHRLKGCWPANRWWAISGNGALELYLHKLRFYTTSKAYQESCGIILLSSMPQSCVFFLIIIINFFSDIFSWQYSTFQLVNSKDKVISSAQAA